MDLKINLSHAHALGDAIVERSSELDAPKKKLLRTPLSSFLDAHRGLTKAQAEVDRTRETRDDAFAEVAAKDHELDAALDALANALVSTGLGARKNPFAAYGKHSPGEIVSLAYAREIDAARDLVARIGKTKDPKAKKAIAPALAAVTQAADGVQKALSAITRPQLAYQKALATRDEHLLDWQKQLSRLKKIATGALVDDPAAYKTLFADPDGSSRKHAKPKSKNAPVGGGV